MTPEEAKAEWERRCSDLPLLDDAGTEFHKVEVPDEILVGDMMEVLQLHEAQGWITQPAYGGLAFWFAAPAAHEKQVREAHEARIRELNTERLRLQERIAQIEVEMSDAADLRDERLEAIERGENPVMFQKPAHLA